MALHYLSVESLFSRRTPQHELLICLALLNMARVLLLLLLLRSLLLIPEIGLLQLTVILLLLLVLGLLNLNQELVVDLEQLVQRIGNRGQDIILF